MFSILALGMLLSIAFSSVARACQVPVFRYALERWLASDYRLQVLHLQPFEKLSVPKHVNIKVEYYRADQLTEAQQWSINGLDKINFYPSHILSAPHLDHPVLIEKTTPENWHALIDSPVRTAIKEKLLSGESAVFVQILSGDKQRDARVHQLLETALAKAQKSIKLPDGVINPDEIAEAQSKGEVNFDDVLRSKVPLKISFAIVTLDPNEPAEQGFYKILLQGRDLSQFPDASFIAPIFGRGRCLNLIPVSKISEDIIISQCQYLCGACACSVKSENPGFDLLFNADWDAHLVDSTIILDKSLPDLTGTGDFISSEDTDSTSVPEPDIPTIPTNNQRSTLSTYLVSGEYILAAIVLVIIGSSFYLYRRNTKR